MKTIKKTINLNLLQANLGLNLIIREEESAPALTGVTFVDLLGAIDKKEFIPLPIQDICEVIIVVVPDIFKETREWLKTLFMSLCYVRGSTRSPKSKEGAPATRLHFEGMGYLKMAPHIKNEAVIVEIHNTLVRIAAVLIVDDSNPELQPLVEAFWKEKEGKNHTPSSLKQWLEELLKQLRMLSKVPHPDANLILSLTSLVEEVRFEFTCTYRVFPKIPTKTRDPKIESQDRQLLHETLETLKEKKKELTSAVKFVTAVKPTFERAQQQIERMSEELELLKKDTAEKEMALNAVLRTMQELSKVSGEKKSEQATKEMSGVKKVKSLKKEWRMAEEKERNARNIFEGLHKKFLREKDKWEEAKNWVNRVRKEVNSKTMLVGRLAQRLNIRMDKIIP